MPIVTGSVGVHGPVGVGASCARRELVATVTWSGLVAVSGAPMLVWSCTDTGADVTPAVSVCAGVVNARCGGRVRRGARERQLVLEEVVQRVAALREMRARDAVVAEIAVQLLRPVADERAHVGPERRVLEPVLQPRLVQGEIARRLAHPG